MKYVLILNVLLHLLPWLFAIILCALIITDYKKHNR